jgi:hypothetical protein
VNERRDHGQRSTGGRTGSGRPRAAQDRRQSDPRQPGRNSPGRRATPGTPGDRRRTGDGSRAPSGRATPAGTPGDRRRTSTGAPGDRRRTSAGAPGDRRRTGDGRPASSDRGETGGRGRAEGEAGRGRGPREREPVRGRIGAPKEFARGRAERETGRGERRGERGAADRGQGARARETAPPRRDERLEDEGPKIGEVLTEEILDELRQTARPHAFSSAARALADAVVALSEDDPQAAVAAGRQAKASAPRSASVRELLGIALYQLGEFKAARTELAAAQRISGQTDLTAMLADVERATGRPEQAIELFRTTDRTGMSADTAAELLLVAASAYGDMGQPAAGVALIRRHARWPAQLLDHHLRLAYAEGSLAEQAGDVEGAKSAFIRVSRTDPDFFDAAERLGRLERTTPG